MNGVGALRQEVPRSSLVLPPRGDTRGRELSLNQEEAPR